MKLWLPNSLYHVFPLLAVIVGFLVIAMVRNPLGVIVAATLYVYAFGVLWLRLPCEDEENAP